MTNALHQRLDEISKRLEHRLNYLSDAEQQIFMTHLEHVLVKIPDIQTQMAYVQSLMNSVMETSEHEDEHSIAHQESPITKHETKENETDNTILNS